MTMHDDVWLTINDLKQHAYCPRIVYFRHCLPLNGRMTFKMVEGQTRQDEVTRLERRRTLQRYGLDEAERRFDVFVRSERLRLTGRVDMALLTRDQVVPVDFKSSEGHGGRNWELQLVAYTMMIEDVFDRPSPFGILYILGSNRVVRVPSDDGSRGAVHESFAVLRRLVLGEGMPAPTSVRGRCRDCEFRRYCNDVW